MSDIKIPTITISSIRGGGGKTIASLGIIRALVKRGLKVSCFKKGPDYIDAAWLGFAAKRDCYNLDPYLMNTDIIKTSFSFRAKGSDVAIIEGNRGLFDGLDVEGSCSTSFLARLIGSKIILVVDCTKATRTIAAIVLGCMKFEEHTNILGVILNQIAGPRHKKIITDAIKKYTGLPVLGAIPRMKKDPLPMRHLGLTPAFEYNKVEEALNKLAELAENHIDIDAILMATQKEPVSIQPSVTKEKLYSFAGDKFDGLTIGIIKDKAFQFYYPENIEAIKSSGAKIIFLDSISDKDIPQIHALYIGGGFPEIQATELEKNIEFRSRLKELILKGLPVYAECGGLMYLGKRVLWQGKSYNMVGALPIEFIMKSRPVGHGYTHLYFDKDTPFFKKGEELYGHEFHYSEPRPTDVSKWDPSFSCLVKRGHGFGNKKEGYCYLNVFGTYSHCHCLGQKNWIKAILGAAKKYKINSNS